MAHLGAIAASYTAVLLVLGGDHVAANVLVTTGAVGAAGAVVANLVGQIRALAFAPVAELRRLWDDAVKSAGPASAPDRASIGRGELVVLYQPIIALQRADAVHVEALLRWDHPERGRVGPADFIPAAEHNGMIEPLGTLVLEDACREIARWSSTHPQGPALRVSVNLSPCQLAHPDLTDRIARAVAVAGVSPDSLCLEVTEGAVMEKPDEALETLHRLRRLGVHTAIDDFGTGYSSLSYLKRLPVDWLKVDRSFVEGVASDTSDVAIIRAIVGMARSLGLTVVAEGVERAEQLAAVKGLGCHMAQGFYFSEAVPIDALTSVSTLAG
jgi:EAL domain-containing protein (putative c-di-GMP-specific phosphodiesterase class I)